MNEPAENPQQRVKAESKVPLKINGGKTYTASEIISVIPRHTFFEPFLAAEEVKPNSKEGGA